MKPTALWGAVAAIMQVAPSIAFADPPAATAAEAAFAARVVDVACANLSPDRPRCDRALLLRSETLGAMLDLMILAGEDAPAPVVARDIVRHGATPEDRARLEAGPDRTLLIHTQHSARGRYPWFETLSIAQNADALQVIGYSYSTYDRAMGGDYACSIDLLSGEWTASAVRLDPETGADTQSWDVRASGHADATDIIWWSYREPPTHCDGVRNAWFDAAP